jgi:hypothetical protein
MIYIDQRGGKALVVTWLEEIRDICQKEHDPDKLTAATATLMAAISRTASKWNVDLDKLMALVTSQVHSGNVAGAIKLIKSVIPDRRMKLLPAIISGFLLWPFRFFGRIIRLGLKR